MDDIVKNRICDCLSDEDLVQILRERGITETNGLLKLQIYQLAVDCLPVLCVDILPVRFNGSNVEVGVIIRATGSEKGKVAVLGGRVRKDQSVTQAIGTHLKKDLQLSDWDYYKLNDEKTPFYVQQYFQSCKAKDNFGYDPSKHAVALNYIVEIKGLPKPTNEADQFIWITRDKVPEITAYNHGVVMRKVFELLSKV